VDVVYYVGGPDTDDRSELRHSLRSLETNYRGDIGDVWVVGDVPAWFTGAKMPLPPKPEKFRNARASITAYVNHTTADEFILTMDDVMVTEPIDRIPICHLGPARNYSAYKTGTGTYARAVRQTTDWLHTHGHPDPLGYLGHTPVPLDTAKVRDFLDDYPADQLLEPFLLYVAAGTAGPGRRTGNAKCAKADNFKHKLSLDIPFISSNPDSWGSELGEWVRSMFTVPSRWER
jgi:hypothetical protein